MNTKQLKCLLVLLLNTASIYSQDVSKNKERVIVEIEDTGDMSSSIEMQVRPFMFDRFIYPRVQFKALKQQLNNGIAKWELFYPAPQVIGLNMLSTSRGYYIEPGDSIRIKRVANEVTISGRGAEKFLLLKELESLDRRLEKSEEYQSLSDPKRSPASSLDDYLSWNEFLNKKTVLTLDLIESKKNELSKVIYERIKGSILTEIEKIRLHKFHSIRRSSIVGPKNQYGLSNEDLCRIYDSTMDNTSSKWLRYERSFLFDPDYVWDMLHDEDYREKGKFFNTSEDSAILGKDPADPFISIYNKVKLKYKGIIKEALMAYTFYFAKGILHEAGFTPKVEAALADYYSQPGYAEAKKIVKDYEIAQRVKWNTRYTQEFVLTDIYGNDFSSKQLKGKIAVFDFWFTGCTGCVRMASVLKNVEEFFKGDTNIVFVSVSTDKNRAQWIKSIAQKKYTTGAGVQLNTGEKGQDHDIVKKFYIDAYPSLEVVDHDGLFIKYDKKKIDPRLDNGRKMISFLQMQLAEMKDGPYVFHQNGGIYSYAVYGSRFLRKQLHNDTASVLRVYTDEDKTFNVPLKAALQVEPAEFKRPDKLLVLSDIEGNFDALRKLLMSNKIIDKDYNWVFGEGHLVFGGDMFDRGNQVTECLWLIYSLEQKAKAAGGYVHFILGNHEIMNMQGEYAYVVDKYKTNATLIGMNLKDLYNTQSELGRWLRTKNVIEKIGDLLFVHGGISRKVNQVINNVTEINTLARPYYSEFNLLNANEKVNTIMHYSTSPFWYRTYYENKNEVGFVIDSTLEKFNVKHIITGHTIVADTISVHYNEKVINTDTKHSEGKSEALLVEGMRFYRVNSKGERILLFKDYEKTPDALSTD
ncbi:hypothetical protein A4H97_09460 [Niastella yeongjuensis]|uniref:Thioredoxin domain-containing protein n=1 Tax=Niastella yeongjuensis TaxID=354355 RepID=A0A1V9EF86_9BACT|nr:metallophosphoesterase [Niastella yeongjuensis]OQP44585.1 hypothetical protein A4H97_09460 [Niastella yeongjuensis]SEO82387.1 Thioredoxin-like [Niastella yeongjuensis]